MIFKNSKLLLVTLSLISIIFISILVWETYNIQLKNKETSERRSLADNDAKIESLNQSIRMVQTNATEDLAVLDGLTLSSDNLTPLIENIEGAGQIFGLDSNIVSVEKIEDKKSSEPDIVRIVVETRGPWAQTLSFLHAIESLPHRVMIDESSLVTDEVGPASPRQGGAGDGASWRLKIILSLYSFN
ncbi:MAG: hypothetical protein Q7K26_03415 [bacterium]|nr:hypothetical protein [bacterium]